MNDIFEKRVRTAAVAGWWVVLITLVFVVLQWLVYLAVTSCSACMVSFVVGAEHRLGFRPDGLVLGNRALTCQTILIAGILTTS